MRTNRGVQTMNLYFVQSMYKLAKTAHPRDCAMTNLRLVFSVFA